MTRLPPGSGVLGRAEVPWKFQSQESRENVERKGDVHCCCCLLFQPVQNKILLFNVLVEGLEERGWGGKSRRRSRPRDRDCVSAEDRP